VTATATATATTIHAGISKANTSGKAQLVLLVLFSLLTRTFTTIASITMSTTPLHVLLQSAFALRLASLYHAQLLVNILFACRTITINLCCILVSFSVFNSAVGKNLFRSLS
jgi:hypothetical protein